MSIKINFNTSISTYVVFRVNIKDVELHLCFKRYAIQGSSFQDIEFDNQIKLLFKRFKKMVTPLIEMD